MQLPRSLDDYAATVARLPRGPLTDTQVRAKRFLLARDGKLEVYWAPFDHVNRNAQVMLVGITPGAQQMRAALEAARDALSQGRTPQTAARQAKSHASFSGSMRPVLIEWLDAIGLARHLDIPSTSEFWTGNQAHFTSTLCYPVFNAGGNYSGSPSMLNNFVLRRFVDEVFLPELKAVRPDVVVGLGAAVKKTLQYAAAQGVLDEDRVLFDLPHPSQGQGFPQRAEAFQANRRKLQAQVRRLLG